MPRAPAPPTLRRLVAGGVGALMLAPVGGCAQRAGLEVVGTVVDDTVTITVPALAVVSVDLDAGFAPDPLATAPTGRADTPSPGVTGPGTFVQVRDVGVREGDRVTAGDVVVTLDGAQLAAQLAVARSAADVAAAQPAVVQDAIDRTSERAAEIADRRTEAERTIARLTAKRRELIKARARLGEARRQLRDKRAQVRRKAADLRAQRATLLAKRAEALAARAQLAQQLRDLQQVLAQLPPDPGAPLPPLPPGTPAPPSREQVLATIAQLEAGIAQVDAGLAQLEPGLAGIDAGLKELTAGLGTIQAGLGRTDAGLRRIRTGLPTLDAGLARARDGLAQLDAAADTLVDAGRALRQRKDQAEIAAQAALIAVQVARRHLADATVTAPADGVVVRAAAAGDVLAPGASLLSIRADAASRATVWLAPEELAQVCVGDRATVRGDWMPAGTSVPATLTRIGERWDYPPTWHATEQVHLTRALPVEVTASTGALPAGVPVEITIDGCRQQAPPVMSPDPIPLAR